MMENVTGISILESYKMSERVHSLLVTSYPNHQLIDIIDKDNKVMFVLKNGEETIGVQTELKVRKAGK